MKVCHGHPRSELGKDLLPSSPIHLWVVFSPSQVVVLKCFLPCWLLATISPYYFLTCPCTSSLLISYCPNLPWISQFVPCCHSMFIVFSFCAFPWAIFYTLYFLLFLQQSLNYLSKFILVIYFSLKFSLNFFSRKYCFC